MDLSVYLSNNCNWWFGDISTYYKYMSLQDIYRSLTSILVMDASSFTTTGDKFNYNKYWSWHYPVFSHSNSH